VAALLRSTSTDDGDVAKPAPAELLLFVVSATPGQSSGGVEISRAGVRVVFSCLPVLPPHTSTTASNPLSHSLIPLRLKLDR
jgi:hypothetical protein